MTNAGDLEKAQQETDGESGVQIEIEVWKCGGATSAKASLGRVAPFLKNILPE